MDHRCLTFMRRYAAQAVKDARKVCGLELDYSPVSVQRLESAFETLKNQPKGLLAQLLGLPGRNGIFGRMYGAYLGEVIRRSRDGWQWEYDSTSVKGVTVTRMNREGQFLWPLHQISKRIEAGDQANLWAWWQNVAAPPAG